MVIYIHGFGSSGQGAKAKLFREYFKGTSEGFIAPSLSYIPELALDTLEELIESYNADVQLIGSSLGGYYSIYLSDKYNVPAVLINPSIYPYKTLAKSLGHPPSFYDESDYAWMQTHINMLKDYEVKELNKKNFMLLVQKGDESLNYEEAVNKCQGATMVIEDGGNHSFENIEKHFESIYSYMKDSRR